MSSLKSPLKVDTLTVRPIIPITGSPVFDNVEPARFQVTIEEVPKSYLGQFTYMGSIVYDDVKSVRRNFICHT